MLREQHTTLLTISYEKREGGKKNHKNNLTKKHRLHYPSNRARERSARTRESRSGSMQSINRALECQIRKASGTARERIHNGRGKGGENTSLGKSAAGGGGEKKRHELSELIQKSSPIFVKSALAILRSNENKRMGKRGMLG